MKKFLILSQIILTILLLVCSCTTPDSIDTNRIITPLDSTILKQKPITIDTILFEFHETDSTRNGSTSQKSYVWKYLPTILFAQVDTSTAPPSVWMKFDFRNASDSANYVKRLFLNFDSLSASGNYTLAGTPPKSQSSLMTIWKIAQPLTDSLQYTGISTIQFTKITRNFQHGEIQVQMSSIANTTNANAYFSRVTLTGTITLKY